MFWHFWPAHTWLTESPQGKVASVCRRKPWVPTVKIEGEVMIASASPGDLEYKYNSMFSDHLASVPNDQNSIFTCSHWDSNK